MSFISFKNSNIDTLKKQALESPKETIKSIDMQFKNSLDKQFYSKAHYLMSLSYNSLKKKQLELYSLNKAIEFAITFEDKIRGLVRRAGHHLDYSQNIDAFKDLTLAEEVFELSQSNDFNLSLMINVCKTYLYMKKPGIFPTEKHIEKMSVEIVQCTDNYIIAHYYKTLGLYYLRQKNYIKSSNCFTQSYGIFNTNNNSLDLIFLYPFLAISLFKLKNNTYHQYKSLYEKHLESRKDKLLTLRYIIAILNCDINPLSFYFLTHNRYLEIANYSVEIENYKTASQLYLFIAKSHEEKKEFDLAISFFKKQSEYNLKSILDEDENKLIDLRIQQEIQHQLKIQKQKTEIHSADKPSFIKDYVRDNITYFSASELNDGKYEIVSNLLIDQFKTQVSICTNYGIKFLETNNIQVLESDGNYTILYDKDAKRHISSKPLAYYEKQLDPKSFLRTHRSYIININYIVHFFPGRVGKIELTNGQIIEVSARKMAEVRRRILN